LRISGVITSFQQWSSKFAGIIGRLLEFQDDERKALICSLVFFYSRRVILVKQGRRSTAHPSAQVIGLTDVVEREYLFLASSAALP
jgi:hypothetical protein